MADDYYLEWEDLRTGEYAEHLSGDAWHEAPLPARWHRCRAQSRGYVNGTFFRRCRCGAGSIDGGVWREKNSRR